MQLSGVERHGWGGCRLGVGCYSSRCSCPSLGTLGSCSQLERRSHQGTEAVGWGAPSERQVVVNPFRPTAHSRRQGVTRMKSAGSVRQGLGP